MYLAAIQILNIAVDVGFDRGLNCGPHAKKNEGRKTPEDDLCAT